MYIQQYRIGCPVFGRSHSYGNSASSASFMPGWTIDLLSVAPLLGFILWLINRLTQEPGTLHDTIWRP